MRRASKKLSWMRDVDSDVVSKMREAEMLGRMREAVAE